MICELYFLFWVDIQVTNKHMSVHFYKNQNVIFVASITFMCRITDQCGGKLHMGYYLCTIWS